MSCVVYFVRADGGLVKIGWTADFAKRLTNLNSASSAPLTVLATYPGGAALEQHIHERFADDRVRGEWFKATPELLGLAGQLRTRQSGVFAAGFEAEISQQRQDLGTLNEAVYFARRLVEMETDEGVTSAQALARISRRLKVSKSQLWALLYRPPAAVGADLYFSLQNGLAARLEAKIAALNNELLAFSRQTVEPRFTIHELAEFDAEIARLRQRLSDVRLRGVVA